MLKRKRVPFFNAQKECLTLPLFTPIFQDSAPLVRFPSLSILWIIRKKGREIENSESLITRYKSANVNYLKASLPNRSLLKLPRSRTRNSMKERKN